MEIVHVIFTGLKVSGFNAKNGSVSLEVCFNDGIEKQVTRTTVIDDPRAMAHSIIDEIKDMERRIRYEFDEDDALKSYVNVVIEDEDAVAERIALFLAEVSGRVRSILVSKLADGYMDKIRVLNRMATELC